MTMGAKITTMRKARGWSQEELTDRVGVTRQAVSRWELDSAKPDADNILSLCDLFGVSADYLLRDDYAGDRTHIIQTGKQGTVLGEFFRGLTLKHWAWIGVLALACLMLFGLRLLYLLQDTNNGDYCGFLADKQLWGTWSLAWCGAILSIAVLFGKQLKRFFIKVLSDLRKLFEFDE